MGPDSLTRSDAFTGLTSWDKLEYEDAAKVMKTALEQGANFWNGVSRSPLHAPEGLVGVQY